MCRKNCGPDSSFHLRLSCLSEGQVLLAPRGLLPDRERAEDKLWAVLTDDGSFLKALTESLSGRESRSLGAAVGWCDCTENNQNPEGGLRTD